MLTRSAFLHELDEMMKVSEERRGHFIWKNATLGEKIEYTKTYINTAPIPTTVDDINIIRITDTVLTIKHVLDENTQLKQLGINIDDVAKFLCDVIDNPDIPATIHYVILKVLRTLSKTNRTVLEYRLNKITMYLYYAFVEDEQWECYKDMVEDALVILDNLLGDDAVFDASMMLKIITHANTSNIPEYQTMLQDIMASIYDSAGIDKYTTDIRDALVAIAWDNVHSTKLIQAIGNNASTRIDALIACLDIRNFMCQYNVPGIARRTRQAVVADSLKNIADALNASASRMSPPAIKFRIDIRDAVVEAFVRGTMVPDTLIAVLVRMYTCSVRLVDLQPDERAHILAHCPPYVLLSSPWIELANCVYLRRNKCFYDTAIDFANCEVVGGSMTVKQGGEYANMTAYSELKTHVDPDNATPLYYMSRVVNTEIRAINRTNPGQNFHVPWAAWTSRLNNIIPFVYLLPPKSEPEITATLLKIVGPVTVVFDKSVTGSKPLTINTKMCDSWGAVLEKLPKVCDWVNKIILGRTRSTRCNIKTILSRSTSLFYLNPLARGEIIITCNNVSPPKNEEMSSDCKYVTATSLEDISKLPMASPVASRNVKHVIDNFEIMGLGITSDRLSASLVDRMLDPAEALLPYSPTAKLVSQHPTWFDQNIVDKMTRWHLMPLTASLPAWAEDANLNLQLPKLVIREVTIRRDDVLRQGLGFLASIKSFSCEYRIKFTNTNMSLAESTQEFARLFGVALIDAGKKYLMEFFEDAGAGNKVRVRYPQPNISCEDAHALGAYIGFCIRNRVHLPFLLAAPFIWMLQTGVVPDKPAIPVGPTYEMDVVRHMINGVDEFVCVNIIKDMDNAMFTKLIQSSDSVSLIDENGISRLDGDANTWPQGQWFVEIFSGLDLAAKARFLKYYDGKNYEVQRDTIYPEYMITIQRLAHSSPDLCYPVPDEITGNLCIPNYTSYDVMEMSIRAVSDTMYAEDPWDM